MNSKLAIEICGLEKSFYPFELGPLDLRVPTGSIYAFIGPNGAGKTTTLDLMFGMGTADDGEIRILGLDHTRDDVKIKRQAAYMSHEFTYTRWHRVGHVIHFIRDFYPDWSQNDCDRLLRQFGINLEQKVSNLSSGQHIKLGLVLALARRARVLVLDEPTSGLDPLARQTLFSELLATVQDGTRSVLISTHNLADVERFADHIGLIDQGRMLVEGSRDHLIESHRHIDFRMTGRIPVGARQVKREGDRVRVISNSADEYFETLKNAGADQVRVHPLSLEELFTGLIGSDS